MNLKTKGLKPVLLTKRKGGTINKRNFGKFDRRNIVKFDERIPNRSNQKKKYISKFKFFIFHNLDHYASRCPERKRKEKKMNRNEQVLKRRRRK